MCMRDRRESEREGERVRETGREGRPMLIS